jgi:hypothetical protein
MGKAARVSPKPSRESRIETALLAEYPNRISAKALMNRAGLSWREAPVCSFVSLCISFSKLNQALSGSGFQAMRSGGTPDDQYWLSKDG